MPWQFLIAQRPQHVDQLVDIAGLKLLPVRNFQEMFGRPTDGNEDIIFEYLNRGRPQITLAHWAS